MSGAVSSQEAPSGRRSLVAFLRELHPARFGAFAVGVAYLGAAVLGFAVTGFEPWVTNSTKDLFGFDLNGFHNVVHLVVGAALLAASLAPEVAITQGVLIGGGVVYLIAAALGFTNNLHQLLSIDGTFAADNFLHLASGALALLFGLLGGKVAEPEVQAP